jgi:hypothetical protein
LKANRSRSYRIGGVIAALAMAVYAFPGMTHPTIAHGDQTSGLSGRFTVGNPSALTYMGTTSIAAAATPATDTPPPDTTVNFKEADTGFNTVGANIVHGLATPAPPDNGITTVNPGASTGFGISDWDHRAVNHNSVEPPDGGVCAGNGQIMNTVNDALRVFNEYSHAPVSPVVALYAFFHVPPAAAGYSVSDPRCIYDATTGRFIVDVLFYNRFNNDNYDLIAISQGRTALNGWSLFALNLSNYGVGPCPAYPVGCFGDQPRISVDNFGLWITVREFSNGPEGLFGAVIYGIPKLRLISYTPQVGTTYPPLPPYIQSYPLYDFAYGEPVDTLDPTVPNGSFTGSFDTSHNGTEYFLASVNYYFESNVLTAFAVTNTNLLTNLLPNSNMPLPNLTGTHFVSETFSYPRPVDQKNGPHPLSPVLETMDYNSANMQEPMYAYGHIWGTITTLYQASDGSYHDGLAWFQVSPLWTSAGTVFSPFVEQQGYIIANKENVWFGAVGVNNMQQATVGFSVAGVNHFPSTGYANYNPNTHAFGQIHIATPGVDPQDGFSGNPGRGCFDPVLNTTVLYCSRWGDYSTATVEPDTGKIVVESEYVHDNHCTTATGPAPAFPPTYPPCAPGYPAGSASINIVWGVADTEVDPTQP